MEYEDNNQKKIAYVLFNEFQKSLIHRRNVTLMGDGTFKYVPSLFVQQYGIHISIGSKAIPVMIIFCESKTTSLYRAIFKYLKNEINVNITKFICDFEKAVHISYKETYPKGELSCCWFHYSQSIIKRVKKIVLSREYNSNKKVNLIIRKYLSLPFIHVDEIENFHLIILNSIDDIEDEQIKIKMKLFDDYFQRTWFEKYPKTDWCQFDDIPLRTNNWSENFHSVYAQMFRRCHPNIFIAIEKIVDVMVQYEYQYNDLLLNPTKYVITEMNSLTIELLYIMNSKDTLYRNEPEKYLLALATANIRLLLRIEKQILTCQGINNNRIKEIDQMLESKKELSLLESEEEGNNLDKEKRHLETITKFHLKKQLQYLNGLVENNQGLYKFAMSFLPKHL